MSDERFEYMISKAENAARESASPGHQGMIAAQIATALATERVAEALERNNELLVAALQRDGIEANQ